jgi:hypothetical protein
VEPRFTITSKKSFFWALKGSVRGVRDVRGVRGVKCKYARRSRQRVVIMAGVVVVVVDWRGW